MVGLDSLCLYVFLPKKTAGTSFASKKTRGYAFINFMTLGALADFTKRFNGRRWDIPGNEQVAEVCPCERHQGLNSIIQYYRNNSSLVSNEWIFWEMFFILKRKNTWVVIGYIDSYRFYMMYTGEFITQVYGD